MEFLEPVVCVVAHSVVQLVAQPVAELASQSVVPLVVQPELEAFVEKLAKPWCNLLIRRHRLLNSM
jgi:hypothetical protein